jgi:hypothetical protein
MRPPGQTQTGTVKGTGWGTTNNQGLISPDEGAENHLW